MISSTRVVIQSPAHHPQLVTLIRYLQVAVCVANMIIFMVVLIDGEQIVITIIYYYLLKKKSFNELNSLIVIMKINNTL